MSNTQTVRYVGHSDVDRYKAMGWRVVTPGLRGTHHGYWSELMIKGSDADSDTLHTQEAAGEASQ